MTKGTALARAAADSDLAGARLVACPGIPAPLAAVFDAVGSELTSVDPIQVTWRPGSALTVRYRVEAVSGPLQGQRQVVATVGDIPDHAAVVEGAGTSVGLWVVPNDPLLPGLASALDTRTTTGLLRDLGGSGSVTSARLRSYRPGRRAVVEVRGVTAHFFLKVVRPDKARQLHDTHRYLARHIDMPDSLGLAGDLGVVVLPALPGRDLRTALRSGGSELPAPDVIASMLDTLPLPNGQVARASSIERLPGVVGLLERLVPEETERLRRIVELIGVERGEHVSAIHGDFYEAQIMTQGSTVVGLLDVDTYGWGHPGDDAATMLAHLSLLPASSSFPARVLEYGRSLQEVWESRLDVPDLRRRTAAAMLGLATGPFRVLSRNWQEKVKWRIRVAEGWADSAGSADERSLIGVSGSSHVRI